MRLDDSSAEASARLVSPDYEALPESADERTGSGRDQGTGPRHRAPAGRSGLYDPVTFIVAAGVTAAYTVISVFRYLRRDPTSWDLGIFTEYVKQIANLRAPIVDIKGGGFNLLGDHFHPIVALVAPFFRLFPSPVTLLVVQALLAGISVLPVSQLGRELLGQTAGRSIAAAYGLSWGLQQMANYDFHEIAFAVPLLAFSLSAMVRSRIRAAVLWALPLVFVKEDQGFTLLAIGLIIAFAYRRYGAGLLVGGWGLLWSLLAILVIIPHFSAQHSYPYWSEAGTVSPVGGHFSIGGLWSSVSSGASTKLPTLVFILLPTALIALRSPVVLAAVPSLVLRALDTNPYYWGTAWHYNATVMPIVFVAAIDAMARIRASERSLTREPALSRLDRLLGRGQPGRLLVAAERYGAAAMLAICAAIAFQFPLSELWTPSTYSQDPHVAAANRAIAKVPNGATVATDLNLLAPLAARADTYWLGNASADPAAQYVVFDTRSTDCTAWEQACASGSPGAVLSKVQELAHGAHYRRIFSSNGVSVFRRVGQ